MKKQKGNIFEEHIEKMVLVIAALLSIGIFLRMVVFSPHVINYDKRTFAPGEIDKYISEQARSVEILLDGPPEKKGAYESRLDDFVSLLACSTRQIDTRVSLPQPVAVRVSVDRRYRVPEVGTVGSVAAEHIRAAAYIPVVAITQDNYRDETSYEPNDLDLVTVEGTFDAAGLLSRFEECFAGEAVKKDWRDPCLAQPVFAAVVLERQELGPDGTWGSWKQMPRPRIEPAGALFEVVENVRELPPGGVAVRMLRMKDPAVQTLLLQPEPYQIASAEEQWLPPALHKDYVRKRREINAQEKRDARAAEAAERDEQKQRERDERSRTTTERRTTTTTTTQPAGGDDSQAALLRMLYGGGGGPTTPSRTTTRPSRTERRPEVQRTEKPVARPAKQITDADILDKYEQLRLKDTEWKQLKDGLLFWAHDDTVKPRQTYRYRLRLGVFNPIAGTKQFEQGYEEYADKVVLWSAYSDVTEPITVPPRVYFFPTDVQEPARAVAVQVSRYALGYWYSEQFIVKRGDEIGKVAELRADVQKSTGDVRLPERIDYSTGAMVVDVVPVNDWATAGSMYARHYYDLLYAFGASPLERVPAKLTYWPDELRTRYTEIRALEKEERKPFKAWGAAGGIRRAPTMPTIPGMPGMPPGFPTAPGQGGLTPDQMYILMMQGQMGQGGQRGR